MKSLDLETENLISFPFFSERNLEMFKKRKKNYEFDSDLSVSGSVFFYNPTSFITKSFENFVIITVFRQLIVTIHPKTGEDLSSDRSPPAFSSLVVFSFLPCRKPSPRRHLTMSFQLLRQLSLSSALFGRTVL